MINVAEILKQVPAGTKLWSNLLGEVEFVNVAVDDLIRVQKKVYSFAFYKDGRYLQYDDSECTLWPSKNHRAWDDEAYKILGIEKKPEAPFGLKPFDIVLVRDGDNISWCIDVFSNMENNPPYIYKCMVCQWKYCIPYNDETKHLLGTNQEPPEKYRI